MQHDLHPACKLTLASSQVLRRDAVRQRCPARGDSGGSPVENREDMVHKLEQLQEQVGWGRTTQPHRDG